MKSIVLNLEKKTVKNDYFREVICTGQHSQLVVMSLLPKEDIGSETHQIVDQFIRIEEGTGIAILDGVEYPLTNGSAVVILAGTKHNIINTSPDNMMKIYTIYSPAHHKDMTIHKTKDEAEMDTKDYI